MCGWVTHSFDDPYVAPYWPTWPCLFLLLLLLGPGCTPHCRQEVSGKSRGLQWKKKLSEFLNHHVYPIHCSKFINITKNYSKLSKSIVRLSSNMFFCWKNLIKNEGITNEFRKPSYEAANRLVTRATQDSNVGYCVGNSNLVSEIF